MEGTRWRLWIRASGVLAACATLPFLLIDLASCNKTQPRVAVGKLKTAVGQGAAKTFKSPDDAGAALLEAAKADDHGALLAIFGPGGKDALFTGDAATDKDSLQDFVAAYNQMHRWGTIKAGGEVLHVGADDYIFPIPLGQNGSGKWYFDTAAGKDEILARRIGRGERTAIAGCTAIADAEHQYFIRAHHDGEAKQFTDKFASDPGQQNGLYWPVSRGHAPSPLGQLDDFAKALTTADTGAAPKQFRGYYYRILTKQGKDAKGGAQDYIVNGKMVRGFGVLAYPVQYRESGIMSFIAGPDGVVYQKDLGPQTAEAVATLDGYDPGNGWTPVTQPDSKRLHKAG